MSSTLARSTAHPLIHGCPPDWATAWGQDGYGIFADLTLPAAPQATQRLRWIPPGRFQMGSPEDEPGRYPNEGPVHQVTISRGFWLFDTPCRQDLWQAVMGQNPSRFADDERPVEQVTWLDCQQFMERLAKMVEGLGMQLDTNGERSEPRPVPRDRQRMILTLPSEAQLEYACRAGTRTATYAGPIKILGANNAPVLDPIAWYGGNSGVDFDRDDGLDSSGWSNKQHDHKLAGTRKVARKAPNAWGLYDMLGNVWEWCLDGLRSYAPDAVVDPLGPTEAGTERVIRGGSWIDGARGARSAYRHAFEPDRLGDLGFRCALVQEPS
ncbi:MAG: formylglycine-generating enzyme family protein [Pirellulaceae bacterium]|nr:formylglycine-generating enzyme family protein [Pirellulaceae bacterium]